MVWVRVCMYGMSKNLFDINMSTTPMDSGCYVTACLTDTDQTRKNTVQIFLATTHKSMNFYLGCTFYNTVTLLWIKDEKKRQLNAGIYEIIDWNMEIIEQHFLDLKEFQSCFSDFTI